MWASKAEGKPVFRKVSRTSSPDTYPSISLSVFRKISSYLAFSAGDTTHWRRERSFCQNETNFEMIFFQTLRVWKQIWTNPPNNLDVSALIPTHHTNQCKGKATKLQVIRTTFTGANFTFSFKKPVNSSTIKPWSVNSHTNTSIWEKPYKQMI